MEVDIHVSIVERLPEIPGELAYRQSEYSVMIEGELEHRVFYDLWTKRCYACLIEESINRKTLYVLKEFTHRIADEVSFSNLLAMERNMYFCSRWILHCSFIGTSQGAILFSAPSGTGKSTQAALWKKFKGTQTLNGDRAGIWRRDDVWYAGGVPWWGTSEITTCIDMPLRAVVLLSQAKENTVSEPAGIIKMKRLLREITANPWNREMVFRLADDVTDLCSKVDVLSLACTPDENAVTALAERLGI